MKTVLNTKSKSDPSIESIDKYKPLVTVVVPAYNEAAIIEKNLSVLCKYMESIESDYRWEIIVVNDGSTDETGELAEAFAKKASNIRVLHHRYNMRLGQALRTAFDNYKGDYVVTMDLDLSYSPDHIGIMLTKMREMDADIVLASPYMKGGKVSNVPWLRKKLSIWANRFLSFASKESVSTLTSMVRAYNAKFLSQLDLRAMHVDIHSEIIYKASILRARIVEIPAHLDWGFLKESGKQRISSMRIMKGITWNLLTGFMFRPFIFFILPGFIILLLSLYPIVWVFIHTFTHYSQLTALSGSLANKLSYSIAKAFSQAPHAFIVGGFAFVIAIQLISLGIVALQNHRYYKDLFHIISTHKHHD